jgi:hypothetical protein
MGKIMSTDWYPQDKDTNEHFAQRVSLAEAYRCGVLAGAEAEREACAKVCDDYDVAEDVNSCDTAEGIAIAIRARGNV